ncbi:hypothetical protein C7B61_14430 [filamentous cyanobacterium CCP1]|nr:hypothetical protein C7B76_27780 [filamentous cyanobacterium CCP2]PSB62534.1 hypothetical protein C7B61_14430 [filamentous cyanobacterium CCP1]
MKTLYRISCRNGQGQVTELDDLLDRMTVARIVRELNERYIHKKVEYFAQPIDVVSLPHRVLTNLFQEGKITYEELWEFAGSRVAEQAMELKRHNSLCSIASYRKALSTSEHKSANIEEKTKCSFI